MKPLSIEQKAWDHTRWLRLGEQRGARSRSSSMVRGSSIPYNHEESINMVSEGSGIIRGESRVIRANDITAEHTLLGEQVVESEVRVPRRRMKEEVVEHVVVVPERRMVEEVVEETVKVREKIIEVAKPVVKERIVEVPHIEYRDKVVEVPEKIIEERIRRVPRIQYEERIKEVPKIITKEKVVEVPDYEYREIPVERIVEVPEVHEEVITREVQLDEYVEVPVPELRNVEVPQDVERYIPVLKESVSKWEFRVPNIKAKFRKVPLPIYAPRFIEVPLPSAYFTEEELTDVKEIHDLIRRISANPYPSLCEVEKLADHAKKKLPEVDSVSLLKSQLETRLSENSLDVGIISSGLVGVPVCKVPLGPRYEDAIAKAPFLGQPTNQTPLQYTSKCQAAGGSMHGFSQDSSTMTRIPSYPSMAAMSQSAVPSSSVLSSMVSSSGNEGRGRHTYHTGPAYKKFPTSSTTSNTTRVLSALEAARELSAGSGVPVEFKRVSQNGGTAKRTIMPDGTVVDESSPSRLGSRVRSRFRPAN